jgi:DNA-binding MarR family transcriptional regulator
VQAEEVDRLRMALGRISRLIDRQVRGDGMTRTQLSVLGTVGRKRSIGMGELADVEGLNPTMLSRIVGKLELAGLLQRCPGIDDRREVRVEITAAGTRLHAKLKNERSQLLAARLADLPAAQVRALSTAIPALESLAAAMRPADRKAAYR